MSRYEWNSKYILKTGNANLAVDLADMKAYLKVDSTADDDLITSLIEAATDLAERYTRREFLNKTFTMYLDFFPYYKQYGNTIATLFNNYTILVKRSKLQSITDIKYYSNDILETLDSSLYDFTEDNDYSRIYLIDCDSVYPCVDCRKQAIEIEFIAGYGDDNTSLPEALKTAIKIIVAYMYENRGDCVTNNNTSDLVMLSGAQPLLDSYKILEI